MPYSFRDRLAFWLEKRWWADSLVLRFDGVLPNGDRRYINRINHHCVIKVTAI